MQPLDYKLHCHLFCEPDFREILKIYIGNAVGLVPQGDNVNSRVCKENLELHISSLSFTTDFGPTASLSSLKMNVIFYYISFCCMIKKI